LAFVDLAAPAPIANPANTAVTQSLDALKAALLCQRDGRERSWDSNILPQLLECWLSPAPGQESSVVLLTPVRYSLDTHQESHEWLNFARLVQEAHGGKPLRPSTPMKATWAQKKGLQVPESFKMPSTCSAEEPPTSKENKAAEQPAHEQSPPRHDKARSAILTAIQMLSKDDERKGQESVLVQDATEPVLVQAVRPSPAPDGPSVPDQGPAAPGEMPVQPSVGSQTPMQPPPALAKAASPNQTAYRRFVARCTTNASDCSNGTGIDTNHCSSGRAVSLDRRLVHEPISSYNRQEPAGKLDFMLPLGAKELLNRCVGNSFLVDCREQTHRCNRLRDLMEECQSACEAAFARCRTKPPPAAVWQSLGPVLFRWGLGEGRRDYGEYVLVTCHWLSANGVRNQLVDVDSSRLPVRSRSAKALRLLVTAVALFAGAAVPSVSEEVRCAWTVLPAAEQLREAHGILTALPAQAQRLPISGYLPHPPPWLPGPWADFLMGLESASLEEAEMLGLVEAISRWRSEGGPRPPSSLQDVAESLRRLRASLPSWGGSSIAGPSASPTKFGMKRGKVGQVESFVRVARTSASLRGSRRILDVGAGLGALTRQLQQSLGLPCLGLDRDPEKVETAQRLATAAGHGPEVSFAVCDIQAPGALHDLLEPDDLVVGLHPCGSLGEDLITAVSACSSGPGASPSLLMVSCCLMGRPWAPIPFPRPPASNLGRQLNLSLPRTALKMSNLWAPGPVPVEAISTRMALRWLLAGRGWHNETSAPSCTSLTPSMRGVTKRHHKEGFLAVASRVLELRGMAPATDAEVADAERVGRIWEPLYRRLELVTPLVGNAAEFAVNADRAAALEADCESCGSLAGVGHEIRTASPVAVRALGTSMHILASARPCGSSEAAANPQPPESLILSCLAEGLGLRTWSLLCLRLHAQSYVPDTYPGYPVMATSAPSPPPARYAAGALRSVTPRKPVGDPRKFTVQHALSLKRSEAGLLVNSPRLLLEPWTLCRKIRPRAKQGFSECLVAELEIQFYNSTMTLLKASHIFCRSLSNTTTGPRQKLPHRLLSLLVLVPMLPPTVVTVHFQGTQELLGCFALLVRISLTLDSCPKPVIVGVTGLAVTDLLTVRSFGEFSEVITYSKPMTIDGAMRVQLGLKPPDIAVQGQMLPERGRSCKIDRRRLPQHSLALRARDVKEIAQELHAIIEELALDDVPSPRSSPAAPAYGSRDAYPAQPQAYGGYTAEAAHRLESPHRPGGAFSPVRDPNPGLSIGQSSLTEELQAEAQHREALLAARQQQDLELEDLRRRQQELERKAAELKQQRQQQHPQLSQWETPTSKSTAPGLPHAAPNPPVDDALRRVLQQSGLRPAPQMGDDMFVGSLPQLRMLINTHGPKATDPQLASHMTAIKRYAQQLEIDLDQKAPFVKF
ncbi:unnamed protein product, partial [Symbiodinium sp. CCMP2456]